VSNVTVKDKGWNKIRKELTTRVRKSLVVGVPESKNAAPYGDGVSIVEVATWNHFGTRTIPARPFISGPIEANKDAIAAMIRRLQKGVFEFKVTQDDALKLLGERVRSYILADIKAGFPPPNADSTIDRKGSDTPLIDMAQLVGSITYEVREE
jgi:hypothetical protein